MTRFRNPGMEADVERAVAPLQAEIEALRAEVERLRTDLMESDEIREKLGHLLTRTAAALKGEPPAGVWHSWHDLPEKAAQLAEALREYADRAVEGEQSMNMINDGGPAFPQSEAWGSRHPVPGGMTLRDYFAAQVMQGLLANPGGPVQVNGMSGWGWCNCTVEDVADFAWHIADAMLKAREAGND